jgi:hypothetical protein
VKLIGRLVQIAASGDQDLERVSERLTGRQHPLGHGADFPRSLAISMAGLIHLRFLQMLSRYRQGGLDVAKLMLVADGFIGHRGKALARFGVALSSGGIGKALALGIMLVPPLR